MTEAGAGRTDRDPDPPIRPSSRSWPAVTAKVIGRALVNPRLALDLTRLVWAFRRRRWWAHPPFLPLPDPVYIRWRMNTAYGDSSAVPSATEIISFARWRRETMGL